ncbi:MAG: PIN domain-containing protein [Myxococcota bacterium]
MKHAMQVYLDDADSKALHAWAKARGWTLSQAIRAALFTSDLVLAEVQRLLLFRAGARAAAAALARLSTSPSLDLLFPDLAIHREAQAYLAKYADQAFTYTDAASFALMKAHRCDAALTFDRHFLVAGFTLWQG